MVYNKIISVMPSAFNYNNYFNNSQLKSSVCRQIGDAAGFNEHYDNFEPVLRQINSSFADDKHLSFFLKKSLVQNLKDKSLNVENQFEFIEKTFQAVKNYSEAGPQIKDLMIKVEDIHEGRLIMSDFILTE